MSNSIACNKGCSLRQCRAQRPAFLTSHTHMKPLRASVVVKADSVGGFADQVLKVAKKIQGALPIVGLISRITSTDGGFDELAYPEFCRSIYDKSPPGMAAAMKELEANGKMATSRYVLLVLWMVKTGLGMVPAKDIVMAARRVRITQDIEIEIDRFEGAKLAARKKYDMMAPPEAKPQDMATCAVDALCTLCLGLQDGTPVAPGAAAMLVPVVTGALPGVSREQVEAAIAGRQARARAYA